MRKALPLASPALVEMLARDGELDRILSGRGLTFERPIELGPPPPPAQPFYIPPPDWDEEERERKARERAAKEAEARQLVAELEPAEPPQRPTAPAKRFRKATA